MICLNEKTKLSFKNKNFIWTKKFLSRPDRILWLVMITCWSWTQEAHAQVPLRCLIHTRTSHVQTTLSDSLSTLPDSQPADNSANTLWFLNPSTRVNFVRRNFPFHSYNEVSVFLFFYFFVYWTKASNKSVSESSIILNQREAAWPSAYSFEDLFSRLGKPVLLSLSLSFIHAISLSQALTFTRCTLQRSTCFLSLSPPSPSLVFLWVLCCQCFMTYSLILAPSRKSIFDGAGSLFSPGLIKDMESVHDLRARAHL